MDAGVLVRPPQILFSIPEGGAPLTYGSNGQFQLSQGVAHGDTDSIGEGTSVSEEPDESSALQGSEVATEPTPSQQPIHLPTPSPTRVSNSPLTTTGGSVKKLPPNEVPTLSPQNSISLYGIPTETWGLSTVSFRPISSSKLVSSFSQIESVSGSNSLTTLLSFNCAGHLGSPCSSPATSTTEGSSTTNSAVQLITIAPVVPAKVSNFGVKPSSWYLAVIFGTIGGATLLIFLITFIVCISRKFKRRRMARNIDVPWAAAPGDEEQGRLFFGSRDLSFRSANPAMIPEQDFAQRLRSSDCMANKSGYTLYNHPIPGSQLFSDETLPPKSERLSLGHHFRPTKLNTLRFLPSHLIDEELADRAIQEDGAHSFSGRPVGLRKRSRGHLDDIIEVNPYINPPNTPIMHERNPTSPPKRQPLVDRLRNLGVQDKEQSVSWDRLPTPGGDENAMEDSEPWASSFKASLFNAFNALSSSIKAHGPSGPTDDRLTQMPTRHRPSIRHSYSSTKSPAWILHERHDGTGTVQFLPRREKQYDSFQSPPTHRSLVPLVSPSFNDQKGEFRRTERPIYPRAPFLPPTAMVHPPRVKHSPSLKKRNPISRDSSIYSTSSLSILKYDPPATSLEGLAGIPQRRSPRAADLDVVVLEPDFLSHRGHSIS